MGAPAVSESYFNQGVESYTYTYPASSAQRTQHEPQEEDIDLEKVCWHSYTYIPTYPLLTCLVALAQKALIGESLFTLFASLT